MSTNLFVKTSGTVVMLILEDWKKTFNTDHFSDTVHFLYIKNLSNNRCHFGTVPYNGMNQAVL